jgi:hypothetical protein
VTSRSKFQVQSSKLNLEPGTWNPEQPLPSTLDPHYRFS